MHSIVDTGTIVALLNRRDKHHAWAREVFTTIAPPMFTCEAVISEACYVLAPVANGSDAVLRLLEGKLLDVTFRLPRELESVRRLTGKFSDVPMSLADACLVRMSELEPNSTIITLNSDFKVYRRNRRQVIPTIMPKQRTR